MDCHVSRHDTPGRSRKAPLSFIAIGEKNYV